MKTNINITCLFCNQVKTLSVEKEDLEKYKSGNGYVQDIFPYLDAGQRELLISRVCNECFDETFSGEE